MRRRLHELLADAGRSGTATARRREGDEPVPWSGGGSAHADGQGTRSGEPDPQRARSTGSTRRGGGRRADRSDFRADRHDDLRGGLHGDLRGERPGGPPDGSQAAGQDRRSRRPRARGAARREDPVAAGSERDARETEAGESRSTPGRTPSGGTVEQAKEACLRLLAVRARSRAELTRRLAAKGYTAEVADAALDRLAEVGLVDDAAFAEQWVTARHTYSGKGRQALAQELRRKGVAPEDSAAALSAVSDDDEHARATEL